MARRQCYHCKEWITEGAAHNCWTTTEAALLRGLSEDLLDAWKRLRETAGGEINKFVGGKMFFVKFGSRPRDPIWPVDIFLPQSQNAAVILGCMLHDALPRIAAEGRTDVAPG